MTHSVLITDDHCRQKNNVVRSDITADGTSNVTCLLHFPELALELRRPGKSDLVKEQETKTFLRSLLNEHKVIFRGNTVALEGSAKTEAD